LDDEKISYLLRCLINRASFKVPEVTLCLWSVRERSETVPDVPGNR
jgi:hypothetical protein